MSSSFTITEATTFTVTHARHLAAKLATDLKRFQRFYGSPGDADIAKYEEEIIQLLKHGYLGTATYGYRKNNAWIEPTVRYTTRDLNGASADDDDPGRIRPGADVTGASFYSYLTYNAAWWTLSAEEQSRFQASLPIKRTGAPEPSVSGYMRSDRTYAAGGRALDRQSVKAL